MKIKVTSICVDDVEKASKFYIEILGFFPKHDFEENGYHWVTVVSPQDPSGVELLLAPDVNHDYKVFHEANYKNQIPAISFLVDDIEEEVKRLNDFGVEFTLAPFNNGKAIVAIFDDTCGNLIQIYQELENIH
ncbi:MAG: VOC family protein [Methanobacteriaceae archaeon]